MSQSSDTCDFSPSVTINSLRIASMFIILSASLFGTSIPVLFLIIYHILGSLSPKFRVDKFFYVVGKSFGVGVILAVGFVHLLPSADQTLTNPCLPSLFTDTYTAFSGLFAMMSALLVQFIQTVALNHYNQKEQTLSLEHPSIEIQAFALAHDSCCETERAVLHHGTPNHMNDKTHGKLVAWLLELGISVHSVLIGVALGVASDSEFLTLLIALIFHQFFEGFALSATVLDAGFSSLSYPMLMAAMYSAAAPVGTAVGLGVISYYNGNAVGTLLATGIMTAISAGILIYDALVNLLTSGITHNKNFMELVWWRKGVVFFALWAGAGFMAVVGLWV